MAKLTQVLCLNPSRSFIRNKNFLEIFLHDEISYHVEVNYFRNVSWYPSQQKYW